MRITEVSHERIKNLGNYESARVSLTMLLDEDDNPQDALAALKVEAYNFLNPKKDGPDSNTIPTRRPNYD